MADRVKFLRNILYVTFSTFVALTTTHYFLQYPIPEFAEKIQALSAIFLFLTGWTTLGFLLLKLIDRTWPFIHWRETSQLWILLFSFALGMGVMGAVVLGLGFYLPGSLHTKLSVLTILTGVLAITGIGLVVRNRSQIHGPKMPSLRPWEWICLLISFGGVVVSLITCFSPITYYDSLVYHLALPNQYLILDDIQLIPFNLYSTFPAQMEMLYLTLLHSSPQPDYAINLLNWLTAAAIGLGVAHWATSINGKKTGWIAWALWWTMPAVLLLSVGGYVDLTVGLYTLLCLKAISFTRMDKENTGWVVISGLLGGMAGATKYTGLIAPILVAVWLLVEVMRKKQSAAKLAVFAISVFIPMSPWLIKNVMTTGNPVFPFFFNLMGGDVGWTKDTAQGYFNLLTEYKATSRLFFDLFGGPWTHVQMGGGFDVLGDFGWPLLIWTAPWAYFIGKKRPIVLILSLYVLGHGLIWFVTKPVLRFLLGALPIIIGLSAITIESLLSHREKWIRYVTLILGIPWMVSNIFLYSMLVLDPLGFDPLKVPLGLQTHQDFLKKKLLYYEAYQYINQNLSASDKVFLLGEQRTYPLKIPYMCANLFAPNPITQVANTPDPTTIHQFFKSEGITHVLVNIRELERTGGWSRLGGQHQGWSHLVQYLSDQKLVYSQSEIFLYRRRL